MKYSITLIALALCSQHHAMQAMQPQQQDQKKKAEITAGEGVFDVSYFFSITDTEGNHEEVSFKFLNASSITPRSTNSEPTSPCRIEISGIDEYGGNMRIVPEPAQQPANPTTLAHSPVPTPHLKFPVVHDTALRKSFSLQQQKRTSSNLPKMSLHKKALLALSAQLPLAIPAGSDEEKKNNEHAQ